MKDNIYIRGVIEALLLAIDSKDWDSLAKLLHNDTCYEVSGFPRFEGKQAVLDYYEHIRPVKSGKHSIDSIISEVAQGVCTGRFVGVKNDGENIDVLFSDVMEFDGFKIKTRRVYYCQPTE